MLSIQAVRGLPRLRASGTLTLFDADTEMDMGWVHPWVGLGWVKKNGPTSISALTLFVSI